MRARLSLSEDVDGYVVTLAAPLVEVLQRQLTGVPAALQRGASYLAGADADYLNSLFSTLQAEYQQDLPGRELQLHSLINLMVVWISRQQLRRSAGAQVPERGREYLQRFNGLVEQQFRQQPSVEQLAHQVGCRWQRSIPCAGHWPGSRRCRSCTSASCWKPSAT